MHNPHFTASEDGHVSVIKAGPDWEVLAVNDMGEQVYATPAPVDRHLYLRTKSALYCFGTPPGAADRADGTAHD